MSISKEPFYGFCLTPALYGGAGVPHPGRSGQPADDVPKQLIDDDE